MPLNDPQKTDLQDFYKKILRLYHDDVRQLVIAAERTDPEQRLSIVSVIELRSAFEHIMRVHGIMEGVVPEETIEKTSLSLYDYCHKNLDKAFAHLCRAAYDAYDVIGIAVAERIHELMRSVDRNALYAVEPLGFAPIRKKFNAALDRITEAKTRKDVGSSDLEKEQFSLYEEAIVDLLSIESVLEEKRGIFELYEKAGRLVGKIEGEIQEISQRALHETCKDATKEIFRPLERCKGKLRAPPIGKEDMVTMDTKQQRSFYGEILDELSRIYEQFRESKNAVLRYEAEEKRRSKLNFAAWAFTTFLALLAVILKILSLTK